MNSIINIIGYNLNILYDFKRRRSFIYGSCATKVLNLLFITVIIIVIIIIIIIVILMVKMKD